MKVIVNPLFVILYCTSDSHVLPLMAVGFLGQGQSYRRISEWSDDPVLVMALKIEYEDRFDKGGMPDNEKEQ